MSWIQTIAFGAAEGRLRKLYDRLAGGGKDVDNVMKIHSLRPHTMEGHMALYKAVLHHSGNRLPKWYLEALGVYVSSLNHCRYCVEHHAAGLARLLKDSDRASQLRDALDLDEPGQVFSGRELAGFGYARRLTRDVEQLAKQDIDDLREAGFDDGEILEINQVVSYFNYVNRTVLGLGVDTSGDTLGLSPGNSEDPKDWSHG